VDDSPSALELPAARERMLRQICHHHEVGVRYNLSGKKTGTAMLPPHARALQALGYVRYASRTILADTEEGQSMGLDVDTSLSVFEDHAAGVSYVMLVATDKGREALAACDARRTANAERRSALDEARVRRFPGVSALADFHDGWMMLDLRFQCAGKALATAVAKGYVDPPSEMDSPWYQMTFKLTARGRELHAKAGYAAEPDADHEPTVVTA
jgi:hypothetical protein